MLLLLYMRRDYRTGLHSIQWPADIVMGCQHIAASTALHTHLAFSPTSLLQVH